MKKTTSILLAVLGSAALLACGGSPPPPAESAPPNDQASLPEPPKIAPTPPEPEKPVEPAPTPLAQVLVTDAAVIQKGFDATVGAPAATLKPDGAKGTDALAKGVRDASKKLPAGMQPDGPMALGSLKEKQHLQTDVTLAPGKCYSIVGFAAKVKDLDLFLYLPPGMLSGQDLTDDNKPIIGGAPTPMCPVASTAITYKLDIFADVGAGDVAVQVYSKGK
jgi:hypothetical protein